MPGRLVSLSVLQLSRIRDFTYSGESHSLAAAAQGENLSRDQPRHRAPSEAVNDVV
jgi:hypothetical protein